jgi:hypothetical protein
MVIFPNKDALPHDFLWLCRSIFVYVMNGTVKHFTKYRIRRHIADRLDVNVRTFMIADVDERNAHYFLICPDEMTKIWAFNLGALTIEPPARRMSILDIRLTGWSAAHEGEYLPLTHRACKQLRKVSLHLWNPNDIHTLIAGFGFPLAIPLYFSNRNYDTLRILIACGARRMIPSQLWMSVEPICKIVDVEVEGWDEEENGPLPPDDTESAVQGSKPPPPTPAPDKPGPSQPAMMSSPLEPSISGQDDCPAKRQRDDSTPE